jgi:hypothetical protein
MTTEDTIFDETGAVAYIRSRAVFSAKTEKIVAFVRGKDLFDLLDKRIGADCGNPVNYFAQANQHRRLAWCIKLKAATSDYSANSTIATIAVTNTKNNMAIRARKLRSSIQRRMACSLPRAGLMDSTQPF